jgi:hypothetical protein
MDSYDPHDPVSVGYRRIWRTCRNVLIFLVVFGALVICWGMPAVQWTYRSYRTKGIPSAGDKIDADYWNPLIGWHLVDADQYAAGCPMIVFIPLRDCMDLDPYRNPVTVFLLPDDFFQ